MRGFVIAASMVFAAAAGPASIQNQGQGQPPKNLQVLPKDMTRQQVVQVMRGFTRGLGVRCNHCHVGEGNDLSQYDFASDAKPEKATARKMIAMVNAINTTHLAGVGEPAEPPAPGQPPAPKVTCYTCHRGDTMPLTAPPPGPGRGGV